MVLYIASVVLPKEIITAKNVLTTSKEALSLLLIPLGREGFSLPFFWGGLGCLIGLKCVLEIIVVLKILVVFGILKCAPVH